MTIGVSSTVQKDFFSCEDTRVVTWTSGESTVATVNRG